MVPPGAILHMMTDRTIPREPLDEDAAERSSAIPHLSKRGWIGVIAGIAVLVAAAAAYGLQFADRDARWQNVGFDVSSPTEASVTFDVFFYSDAAVQCELHALNVRFAQVGVAFVTVDPADGLDQRITHSFVTTEQATTAIVETCTPLS